MVTRRQLIIGGALAGAAALGYEGTAFAGNLAKGNDASPGDSLPFSVPMPIPPVLRPAYSSSDIDVYLLQTRTGVEQITPGFATQVSGYNGTYIGPTIKAQKGKPVLFRHTNLVDREVATHLHGGHVPADQDGYPTTTIAQGATRDYHYPNAQGGATLWYHDHAHMVDAENVFRGHAGFYLLHDPGEDALGLPSGCYDVPIMLRDVRLDDNGQMVYELEDFENRHTVTANGRVQPFFAVANRRYRFRMLNASNLRTFELGLADGGEIIQIGGDQGLLPAPNRVSQVVISPGERVELVIDFARYPVGTSIVLTNVPGETAAQQQVLRFDVTSTAFDTSKVPSRLAAAPSPPTPTNTRTFEFGPYDPSSGMMMIDGKMFDPNRVDQTVRLGATEIWQVHNADTQIGIPHNLHIHLVRFKVLDRDGAPPPASESGWKDTVLIHPGETVRVVATFDGTPGRYLYHCHMIDHASMGMMAQFEIVQE